MKVLLVDDEPLALDFIEVQLKKVRKSISIHKLTALDIEEHEKLLNEIDVLFLDIEMPEVNGLELAEQVSERYPGLPIVFVTAYNEYAIQAFELNVLDYLLKPVQAERLENTLKRIPARDRTKTRKSVLRIKMCKEFHTENDEGGFEPIRWRTSKAQELFLYLLHYSGKPVSKSEIIELLWENMPQEKSSSQLYTTIYYIRRNLSAYRDHFMLENTPNGYVLNIKNIKIDVSEWEKEVLASPPIHQETIQLHEQLMTLYTGNYLGVYHYTWAENEQFRLEQVWVEHAKKIGMYYESSNELEQAIHWLRQVVDIRPEDEHVSFLLMKLYADLQLGLLVHHQYKKLSDALEQLDVPMPAKISQWYAGWKK